MIQPCPYCEEDIGTLSFDVEVRDGKPVFHCGICGDVITTDLEEAKAFMRGDWDGVGDWEHTKTVNVFWEDDEGNESIEEFGVGTTKEVGYSIHSLFTVKEITITSEAKKNG